MRRRRAALASAGVLAITATAVTAASAAAKPPAAHEVYAVPPSGSYAITGHGSGHGHGLSQWGAYGAAKVAHLSSNQILAFYYPHTTLATKAVTQTIRVLLTAANAASQGYLELAPADGLSVTSGDGSPTTLPTVAPNGDAIDGWRLGKSSGSLVLLAHWAGAWHVQTSDLAASATVSDPAALIGVVEPKGSSTRTVQYRGTVAAELQAGALQAVNVVTVESYIDSVVPSEMPSSWPAAALQAQAVAARTYAWRAITAPKASWYDLDGDTRDQAYPGVSVETATTNNAVQATAGEVAVDSAGAPIFAQYSSSDGGWTVSGGQPYLPAKHDPYDGAVPNGDHTWSTTLPATKIAAAFPSVGTLRQLVVTGRDGHGAWGGRVTSMSIVGSAGTVSVSGAQFQAAAGLPSAWFRPTPPPAAPASLAGTVTGHSVALTWKAPPSVPGSARVTGYRVRLAPGGARTAVAAGTTTATFTNVAPGSYTAKVVARSAAGNGPAASTQVTVTLD